MLTAREFVKRDEMYLIDGVVDDYLVGLMIDSFIVVAAAVR